MGSIKLIWTFGLFVFLLPVMSIAQQHNGAGPMPVSDDSPTVNATTEAERLYREGFTLFKKAKDKRTSKAESEALTLYRQAGDKFDAAYRYDPSPILLYNLARVAEELGELRVAIDRYKAYLARYPEAEDAPVVTGRIQALEKVTAAAQSQPTVVQGTLLLQKIPTGSLVKVDDKALLAEQITKGQPIYLDPGNHQIMVLNATGNQLAKASVKIEPKAMTTWEYKPPVPIPFGPNVLIENPPLVQETKWGYREYAYVGFGASAVALTIGTILGIQAKSDAETAEKSSEQDSVRNKMLGANISFGVGLAAAGAATYLFFTSQNDTPSTGVTPTPSGVSFTGQW